MEAPSVAASADPRNPFAEPAVDDASGAFESKTLFNSAGAPENAYYADGTTEDWYTGITGAPYTSATVKYDALGDPTAALYTGGSTTDMTEAWTYYAPVGGAEALSSIQLTNVPPAFASYVSAYFIFDPSGALEESVGTNSAGNSNTNGYENNLLIPCVTGNDWITGGGTGETFVLTNPGTGIDAITDFASNLTGAGHDTLELSASQFSGGFSSMMAATTFSGSNATINLGGGASVTLLGLTEALANANPGDFKFV